MVDDLASEGRNDVERRFLRRLSQLQPPYCDVWTFASDLIVTVTVADPDHGLVLRTLRVDFDGSGFVAGNDPSHQISEDLDPEDRDRLESPTGLELAERAMAWLRAQANRPIDRQEWNTTDSGLRRWVLADTGHALALQESGGVGFAAGGAWETALPARGGPDRVIRLRA